MFSNGTTAWIVITMALLSVVTLSPAGALAQEEPAPFPPVQQEPELPSYDVSIALFVTASIMGPLGTFGSLGGVLGAIAQSAGEAATELRPWSVSRARLS